MRIAIAAAIALLAAGCSSEQPATTSAAEERAPAPAAPPTPEAAGPLIAGSATFGDFDFSTGSSFSLPVDVVMRNEPARQGAEDLASEGWIRDEGGKAVLTQKAQGDKRFLVRPNGFIDIVPLAKKELIEVSAVRPVEDGVEVDFTWRWIPNEVGSAFKRGIIRDRFAATHDATAKLQDLGSGWEVMLIRRRE